MTNVTAGVHDRDNRFGVGDVCAVARTTRKRIKIIFIVIVTPAEEEDDGGKY